MRLAVQRQRASQSEPSGVPPIVHEVLRTPGQPLDPATRAFMEPRFGHDFSEVRVHTDAKAAESARAVNALAYTVGRDVVFGAGQYAPRNPTGQLLMSHELTHVLQQGKRDQVSSIKLGSERDSREQEASTVSIAILTNPARQSTVSVSERVEPGTVQGGWPLIVGVGVGIGAGIYAIWAYNCLSPLEIQMFNATFGDSNVRAGEFRLWYYTQTRAPVPSNIWDAFGHCWIACESTKRCGSITAAIAGKSREFWREYIDSDPHDSYEQDTNNQTLGRSFGSSGANCTVSCQNAALPGHAMDLSAPQVTLWTPATGEYSAPRPAPAAASSSPDAGVPSAAPRDAGVPLPGGVP